MYKCEQCPKIVTKVYGDNINGKFTYRCEKCTYKKKK